MSIVLRNGKGEFFDGPVRCKVRTCEPCHQRNGMELVLRIAEHTERGRKEGHYSISRIPQGQWATVAKRLQRAGADWVRVPVPGFFDVLAHSTKPIRDFEPLPDYSSFEDAFARTWTLVQPGRIDPAHLTTSKGWRSAEGGGRSGLERVSITPNPLPLRKMAVALGGNVEPAWGEFTKSALPKGHPTKHEEVMVNTVKPNPGRRMRRGAEGQPS
jgi:hypothetical protein